MKTSPEPGEFTRRLNLPYLLGVYLAVNAVRDLYLIVDGPDCVLHKAEFIFGRHDSGSTLLDPAGRHRIVFTNVTVNDVASDWEGRLARTLREVRSLPGCGAVLLTAMPVCALSGMQYERVSGGASGRGAPAVSLDPGSLHGDWLDGYAQALAALAGNLPLAGRAGREGRRPRAAIVAPLNHRGEGDCLGDAAELKRLARAAGLDPVSVWPEASVRGLRRAGKAEIVVSLPHARAAARVLAGRVGAELVETGLPLGIEASRRWVRRLAEASGRKIEAERFLRGETSRVFAALERLVAVSFLGRRLSCFLEPHSAAAFGTFAGELGLRTASAAAIGRKGHLPETSGLRFEPRRPALEAALEAPADLVVANSLVFEDEALGPGPARMELGFPSWYTHALTARPSLGFQGALSLAERMADALSGRGLRGGAR